MKQANFKISEKPHVKISQEKDDTEKTNIDKANIEKDTKNSVLMTPKIPIKKVENIYYL